MNVNSVLQSGLEGIQRGQQGALDAASEIAQVTSVNTPSESSAGPASVIEPIVDLQLYERTVEASVEVVKTADEVLGTLLDTLA